MIMLDPIAFARCGTAAVTSIVVVRDLQLQSQLMAERR